MRTLLDLVVEKLTKQRRTAVFTGRRFRKEPAAFLCRVELERATRQAAFLWKMAAWSGCRRAAMNRRGAIKHRGGQEEEE
jgi:hypothetical protein